MKLLQILVRHYKSFNYDYERKAKPKAQEYPWEVEDEGWFPFVTVPLESDITAVVGANESGKSHLLDAIEVLLQGRSPEMREFCRYSTLFSVENGMRRFPDFAGQFELESDERKAIDEAGLPLSRSGHLLLWRAGPTTWKAIDEEGTPTDLDDDAVKVVAAAIPRSFRLQTNIPLPDSISIRYLAGRGASLSRRRRNSLWRIIKDLATPDAYAAAGDAVLSELAAVDTLSPDSQSALRTAQQDLGGLLLLKVAKIERSTFGELEEATETSMRVMSMA